MRLLTRRQDVCQRVGLHGQGAVDTDLSPQRDRSVAAAETVTLVLDEDSPLPESSADVEDLVRRLRGHVVELGARSYPGAPALLRAQRLCSESIPEGYMPSRVYLVQLAEATQELVAYLERVGPGAVLPEHRRRWRKPRIIVLHGAVFAVTLACLVWSRFGAADITVTGAVVIELILVPMAWLVLRGERATVSAAACEESSPSQISPPPPR